MLTLVMYIIIYILIIRLKLTQQLGEKFAKFNVVDDSLDLDDISNQDKCKKGKKNDFLLISSYTDGSINEIDLSAFELGRLVLSQHTDMFARLKTQVPPQQLTNLLQQLSAAGCKKAQKKLNTIGKFIYECVSYNMPNPINNYLIHLLYIKVIIPPKIRNYHHPPPPLHYHQRRRRRRRRVLLHPEQRR